MFFFPPTAACAEAGQPAAKASAIAASAASAPAPSGPP
ncbi:hypothetical protein MetexDRAFT_2928, partial [Methylorubrum extorquens DSM 13060]